MTLLRVPISVLIGLQKIYKIFLWASKNSRKFNAFVKWRKISIAKCFGGWDFHDLAAFVDALALKGYSRAFFLSWVVEKNNFYKIY